MLIDAPFAEDVPSDDERSVAAVADDVAEDLSRLPDFMRVAILQRRAEEAAALRDRAQRADAAADRALRFRGGSRNGSSVLFSLRLSHADFATLQRQAAERSIPPSVLARNLIHCGLKDEVPAYVPRGVGGLDALAERVRRAGRG